jgi:RNA polymerase sigma-70 factor, ECF subfamily
MILEEIMKITDFFKSTPQDPSSLEARFSQGDMNALEEIMLTHQNGIYQLGLRLFSSRDKAADFYQDVFIRLHEKHQHYNPNRPLKPWIYQVAMNLGRDSLRRKREIIMDDERIPEQTEQPQGENQVLADEVKAKVWQVMNQLNPTYREVLALRFSSDLSLKEIAHVLGISLSAAKVRLCRGVKAFESSFKAQGGEQYVL